MRDKITAIRRLASVVLTNPLLPNSAREMFKLIIDLADDIVRELERQVPAVKDSGAANLN